ncbi:hypothetical protein KGO06_02030 [Patescibacteria group bacterium]|nr:hypothetical protein [Patescibacteria group bacterium]
MIEKLKDSNFSAIAIIIIGTILGGHIGYDIGEDLIYQDILSSGHPIGVGIMGGMIGFYLSSILISLIKNNTEKSS